MIKILKKYKLIILAVVLYGTFFFVKPEIFFTAVRHTWTFLLEMLQVLPPVLVISALIMVWVPSKIIERGLGRQAGIKGKLLSLFIGSVSAGPIYAAFPAVLVLFKKGASVSNMVIILSAWAVVKLPMILVEISFLGIAFALTRVALTVPAIFLLGFLVEKLVKKEQIGETETDGVRTAGTIMTRLPQLNCRACGYDDCISFAEAVMRGEKRVEQCVVLWRQTAKEAVTYG